MKKIKMKYIITESRLTQFMKDYLNSFVDSKVAYTSDPYLIVSEPNQGDDELWEDYMEWDRTDGRLWVNKSLYKNLLDLFAMEENELKKFIVEWFENRFNVQVKFIQI
jgi:hypothetical protein